MTTATAKSGTEIHDQVRLPVSVAFEVVLQGIKTRLGRSVVTITGVVLGIAFLMSILAGQEAREGVGQEMTARAELKRMMSFLTAESGPLKDRAVGVIQVGRLEDLEDAEVRLVRGILAENPAQVRWAGQQVPGAFAGRVKESSVEDVAEDASAVLVLGQGALPAQDWTALLKNARQKVVGLSRAIESPQMDAVSFIRLSRALKPEEVQAMDLEKQKASFRSLWIIIISLGVTVIGISNAMLMSVTERFREIGTMKCLGALSSFIRRLFLIESSLMGALGGLAGVLVGAIFSLSIFGATYGFGLVLSSVSWPKLLLYGVASVVASVVLSIVAALYPASFAARMVPATALRTNI